MNDVIDITLPFNYKCRDYQLPFWKAMQGKKRGVLVWHRRSGKDKTCWNYLIKEAAKRVGVYFYFFPTYGQGKKVIWDNIDKQGFKLINHIPKELMAANPNNTEMKIRLINGSIIQIVGTNDIDSIVGTNPVGCVFSEFSLQDPKVWTFIRPILRENGGWALFNGTPRGANHFKEIYDMACGNDEWFVQLLGASDTHAISEEDIQKERDEGMSEDMIQQEFYCSFTLGVEGSYYAKYIQDARDEDRIGRVPWGKQSRVYTVWDLGYGDSTAIIFYQVVGKEIHIIDYYENNGEGLPHYAEVLFRKPYLYADHFAPHDIESRGFSTGMSGRDVGASLGIKFTTLPTLQVRIEDGIEAARGIFPRVYLDEVNCKQLIKCLGNYRKEFDSKHNVYRTRPVHDWSSHGCFVADTKITTNDGGKNISDIKEGDLVLTPNGYKKVVKTFVYESDDLLEVTTTSSSFTCTSNHKIFTNEGLIHADALRYNTTLFALGDIELCRKLFGSMSSGQNIGFRESFLLAEMNANSCSMDISSDGMANTMQEELLIKTETPVFKGVSGHIIMGKYLQSIISTIKTTIRRITIFPTWNALERATTPSYMGKQINGLEVKGTELNCLPTTTKQKSGILRQKGMNGIESMQKYQSTPFQSWKCTVPFVREPIKPGTLGDQNTAVMDVSQELDTYLELMTKKEPALFARPSLSSINTELKERVLKVVPLRSPVIRKVYDFEVEDDHCYYANGILVSNSDAFRYLAIAIKRFVDSKGGPTDDEVDALINKYQPIFN